MFNFTSTLLAWKQKNLLHSLELLHFYALSLRRAKQHQSCRQSNRTLVQCQVLMGAYMLFKTMCVVSLNYTQLMVLMCDDGRRLSIKIHRTNSQPFSSFPQCAFIIHRLCADGSFALRHRHILSPSMQLSSNNQLASCRSAQRKAHTINGIHATPFIPCHQNDALPSEGYRMSSLGSQTRCQQQTPDMAVDMLNVAM